LHVYWSSVDPAVGPGLRRGEIGCGEQYTKLLAPDDNAFKGGNIGSGGNDIVLVALVALERTERKPFADIDIG